MIGGEGVSIYIRPWFEGAVSVTSMMALYTSLVVMVVVVVGTLASPPTNTSIPFHGPEPRVNYNTSCRCGQKAKSRIVGGVETEVNEWPWMAALMYAGVSQFCGGSLINDRYVLTAAHCTVNFEASEITVRLAEHDLSSNGETSVVIRSVSQIIAHSAYEEGTEENDISLLKLSSPVKVGPSVLPVCLPPPTPKYRGKMATVTGWGTLSSGGGSSSVLREVDVKVLSNWWCRRSYGSSIISSMLCASAPGKDSCQGDSGGPLVFKDGGNNYDQIGVVSWGYGCAATGYPGVYTRVNSYLGWIKQNTGDGVYCAGMKL